METPLTWDLLSFSLVCTVALHLQLSHSPTLLLNSFSLPPCLPPPTHPPTLLLSFQSPPPLAVLTRQKKVIQYLLQANANLLMCDCDGNAPLNTLPAVADVKKAWTHCWNQHINVEAWRIPDLTLRPRKVSWEDARVCTCISQM